MSLNSIRNLVCGAAVVTALGCVSSAQSTGSLSAYANAVQISSSAQRLAAMQRFVADNPNSSLAHDATEVAAWDALRSNNRVQSVPLGNALLRSNPDDALGRAAVVAGAQPQANANEVDQLNAALADLNRLHKPEGLSEAEFTDMRRQVWLVLDGAVGLDELALQRFDEARPFLKLAVSVAPNNPRYVYSYALALLSGKNPDKRNGYWQLARAVNLNASSPTAAGIAKYARDSYVKDGGTDGDWRQFVAVTAIGTSNQATAMAAYKNASPSPLAAPYSGVTVARNVPPPPMTKPAPLPPASKSADSDEAAVRRRRPLPPATDPVSLGILLQTNLLHGQNRQAIINAITDLIRHLRENDEAFLMAYSDQLDFEQDLTSQDQLLQDALDHLKPRSGAALMDGVSFAVGHLDRLGKNRNRVLLVLSDGSNTVQSPDAIPLTAQMNDVRIDCIGIDASGASGEELLRRLAQYSGGHAIFASDPQDLRNATWKMAQAMGIDFQQ